MAKGNGHDQGSSNVASLDEARRQAAARAKAEAAAKRAVPGARSPRTLRDLLVGGTIIVMALSFLASLVLPLVKG